MVEEEVRCAVCKSVFCCLECRKRHEENAHSANDVKNERNRSRCGFCQGFPTMEFHRRNDFALIMHLCETHLPLHCKKCLTQFNSVGDFSAANKCAHMNEVCSLQSPSECNSNKIENQSINHKDVSNVNYITAVQKSSFERSISDSVISLRNYSTILHTSNHPLYKTQSPDAMEKALVRQTSTPMQHNLMAMNSTDSIEHPCSSCLVSSTSGHMSNIDTSSDCETSINAASKPTDIRQNVQQQSIMVTQKKTTTFKRSRHSLAGTPLTRQVMTKSIHRAILEYQHSQHGVAISPKSPLDLRVRSAVYRVNKDHSKSMKCEEKSLKFHHDRSVSSAIKSNSIDSNSRLETVYEQEKDSNTNTEKSEHSIDINRKVVEVSIERSKVSATDLLEQIQETPVLVSRKFSGEKLNGVDEYVDPDVWYTPKEYVQSKLIENIEIYTPKVSKKRITVRRFEDDEYITEVNQLPDETSSEPQKSSSNKIWSFVSTFLRFASFTPPTDLSMPDLKTNDTTEHHFIIKRCASFTGILREKSSPSPPSSDEEDKIDPLQPIKRRRITSIDTTLEQTAINYRKRIMCRPPIRRMLTHS